jgi:hypothetical protein
MSGGMAPDLSMFADVDPAFFCPIFEQSLTQAGMTRQTYIDQLNQVRPFMPADSLAQIDAFVELLNSCG